MPRPDQSCQRVTPAFMVWEVYQNVGNDPLLNMEQIVDASIQYNESTSQLRSSRWRHRNGLRSPGWSPRPNEVFADHSLVTPFAASRELLSLFRLREK